MSPTVKEMILWEKKQKNGMNDVVYYLLVTMSTLMAFALGFRVEESHWEISMIWGYAYMHLLGICIREATRLSVKEKGKNRSVFYKYLYTPVEWMDLYKAKLYVIGKDIIKITLIQQILAFVARLIDGQDFSYMGQMLVPTYAGIVLLLGYAFTMWRNCCKCKRG